MADVEFWFEFASTYSYLSVGRIGQVADAVGVDLRWRAFPLGLARVNILQRADPDRPVA